jgi:hypothetical protein
MITTSAEFIRLRQSEVPEEYMRAGDDEADLKVWLEVIDRHPEMRQWVAQNKTVPISILEVLSLNSDQAVRYTVATRRKLSYQIFVRLARDPDESIRAAIARNPKVPQELLDALVRDDSPFVSSVALSRVGR